MSLTKANFTINTLESHIENREVSNPKISKANVAWHIDHSLKVINNVIIALQNSDPKTYKNNLSFLGRIILLVGSFPRGRAKAPKTVIPPKVILEEDIIAQFKAVKTNIKLIDTLDKNAYFKHPIFGNINKAKIYRFMELHTKHHLKIIDDILRK